MNVCACALFDFRFHAVCVHLNGVRCIHRMVVLTAEVQQVKQKTNNKSNPHEIAGKTENSFFCTISLHLFFIKDQIKTNKKEIERERGRLNEGFSFVLFYFSFDSFYQFRFSMFDAFHSTIENEEKTHSHFHHRSLKTF